jgi:hypothetical protein
VTKLLIRTRKTGRGRQGSTSFPYPEATSISIIFQSPTLLIYRSDDSVVRAPRGCVLQTQALVVQPTSRKGEAAPLTEEIVSSNLTCCILVLHIWHTLEQGKKIDN